MSLSYNKNNSLFLIKTHQHQHSIPITPPSLSKQSYIFPSLPLSSISSTIPFQPVLPVSSDYLSSRKLAIMYVKDIIKAFNFPQQVLYKAITYIDTYFHHKQLINANIYHISAVCVLMALQYNECCVHNNITQLFTLMKTIPNVLDIEYDILNVLDYDLGMMSVYDYICMLFKEGVLFRNYNSKTEENDYKYEVEYLLKCAKDLLCLLVNDERFVDFSPFIMAITIIRIVCEANSVLFDKEMFQYTYNINFKHINYVQCLFVTKTILPYIMKDNVQNKYNNSKCKYNNIINITQKNVLKYSNNTYSINQKPSSYVTSSFSPDLRSSSTVDSLSSPY